MCFCKGHETSQFETFGVDGYTFHRGCVNDVIRKIIKAQGLAKEKVITETAYVIN